MKKITIAVLALTMLMIFAIAPVLAAPTNNPNKVPVTLTWEGKGTTTLQNNASDGLSHRILRTKWNVNLTIDGSPTPIKGNATCIRHVLYAFGKLQMAIYQDDYELYFPIAGGGFEGICHVSLYNYQGGTNYDIMIHAIFHGTGAFEGQTLNVGRDRGPSAFTWEGFLLKK